MEEMIRWRPARGGATEPLTLGLMIGDEELSAQVLKSLEGRPVRVVMELREAGTAPETVIDADLRRSNPDLVILEIAAAGGRFQALIWLIKNRPEPPAVITIHATADPDALLGAIRAGASDCLYQPLEEGALGQIVDRVAQDRAKLQPRRPHAKTAGFLSVTGGCGSTLMACHFASELRRLGGQNVLLCDFDVVSGMVGFWMRASNGYSIRDAVRGLQRLDISLWRGLVSAVQPHLEVVTAPMESRPRRNAVPSSC